MLFDILDRAIYSKCLLHKDILNDNRKIDWLVGCSMVYQLLCYLMPNPIKYIIHKKQFLYKFYF